ncbi:single-stranded DNA-binding protein [Chitinimonas sp. PSY-7]|uniref:single-stranded DNA-binding protein n=1 Tax=Chitinimonas sp. PSY-7 TaxID=3459088 RepID=UPI00404007A9
MPSLNKVMLIGNLGRDPEVRYMPDGSAVCSFSVATTERWKDKHTDQSQEQTEWHNIVVYRRLAVITAEYPGEG